MKFKLHDHITITELGLPGRVKQIVITDTGIQYEVRYFFNSDVKIVWFYGDELELIDKTKLKIIPPLHIREMLGDK